MKYDLLHVVPPMSAHEFIRTSGLAFVDGGQAGWLKVDQETLQQLDYKNIFGIGDVTGTGKVILAEFGYDGKLMPSFPMDMTRERRSMWILKKDLLPQMYWKGMMKGLM